MSAAEDEQLAAERRSPAYPFNTLQREVAELYGFQPQATPFSITVPTLHEAPTPIAFLRDYVSRSQPLLIKGGARHWPALSKWSNAYLTDALQDQQITVAVTPLGLQADAVSTLSDGVSTFVEPHEMKTSMQEFLRLLESQHEPAQGALRAQYYAQFQNSSLTAEYPALLNDIAEHAFAHDVFSSNTPEAVNLWIGRSQSISSMHHDLYENLYTVVSGIKRLYLHPPTSLYYLKQQSYCKGKFTPTAECKDIDAASLQAIDDHSGWKVVMDDAPDSIPWFSPTTQFSHFNAASDNAALSKANGLYVEVSPGDVLYLPAMWYHTVAQVDDSEGRCIAVNHWWDMQFDHKWASYQFMSKVIEQRQTASSSH